MKRFIVFAGTNYYPGGGWSDFAGGPFETLVDAEAFVDAETTAVSDRWEWSQIVDLSTSRIVVEHRRDINWKGDNGDFSTPPTWTVEKETQA